MKKKRFNNGGSAAIFVKFIVFTAIAFASCKKSETGKAHTATLAGTAVNPTANADSAYNGFLNAFLVKSGGKTYITNGLVDRDEAYMWGQVFMITAMEDAYDRSNSAYRKQVVSDLLTTFITDNESNWSWDSWNDDVAWAIIPFIRGYQITGNTNYLTIATQNWNMAWSRGLDNVTGGGLWENQDKFSKAALSNDPYIISGCFIYEATKDTIYLARCKQIYTWVRASLFDPATGVYRLVL